MSKTLILHIGPGKCGSSSIQNFFHFNKRACEEKYSFWEVPPHLIDYLELQQNPVELDKQFYKPFKKLLKRRGHTILSHEFFFQRPKAIRAVCQFANSIVDETIIIGYARKQSDWIISAFSQWIFRSKIRLEENTSILAAHGINPIHFTQLEKHLIAGVITDFKSARQLTNQEIFYWNKGYQTIQELVEKFNVQIEVGLVPTIHYNHNLIKDFCQKAKLTIKEKFIPQTHKQTNKSFANHITEIISLAIEQGQIELPPHAMNEKLHQLSEGLSSLEIELQKNILTVFKAYTNNFFFEHNQKLCEAHKINLQYFKSSTTTSKNEVLKQVSRLAEIRNKGNSMLLYSKSLNTILAKKLLHEFK